jgi:hypothetical protein
MSKYALSTRNCAVRAYVARLRHSPAPVQAYSDQFNAGLNTSQPV